MLKASNTIRERIAKAIETDLNTSGAQLTFLIRTKGLFNPTVSLCASITDRYGEIIQDLGTIDGLRDGYKYSICDLPKIFKVEMT